MLSQEYSSLSQHLRQYSWLGIDGVKKIESKYSAKYLIDSCAPTQGGGYANFPFAIFYCDKKHPDGSNFLAVFNKVDPVSGQFLGTFVTDGHFLTKQTINAVVADDGELIYSRYRHDARSSKDGSVTIDGGRDYCKIAGAIHNKSCTITFDEEGAMHVKWCHNKQKERT